VPKKKRDNKPRAAELVLWSDASLLVVNKPAGVLTIPGGVPPAIDLLQILEPAYGRLWVVHRLDRDTSGVLVLARTPDAHRALNGQFEAHTVHKIYRALVSGDPPWTEQVVDLALEPDGDRRHRTVVIQRDTEARAGRPGAGKPAVTECRVLERFGQYALVEAIPKTGRTHQIRAHLSALGTPIVADALYGGGTGLFLSAIKPGGYTQGTEPERPLLARTGLHALALTLEHPLTQETLHFEAPYPKDLSATLRQLGKYCT
jgi:RluA family pseudouridine synthase